MFQSSLVISSTYFLKHSKCTFLIFWSWSLFIVFYRQAESRTKLYDLRNTWDDVFAPSLLYTLDITVRNIFIDRTFLFFSRWKNWIRTGQCESNQSKKTRLILKVETRKQLVMNFPLLRKSNILQVDRNNEYVSGIMTIIARESASKDVKHRQTRNNVQCQMVQMSDQLEWLSKLKLPRSPQHQHPFILAAKWAPTTDTHLKQSQGRQVMLVHLQGAKGDQ